MSTAKMNRCVSACVVSTIAAVLLSWVSMTTHDLRWTILTVALAGVSVVVALYVAWCRYG